MEREQKCEGLESWAINIKKNGQTNENPTNFDHFDKQTRPVIS